MGDGESGDLFDDYVDENATSELAVPAATVAALIAICAAELKRLRAAAGEAT